MISRRAVMAGLGAVALSACAPSKFKTYHGPRVTRIQVFKGKRQLQLLNNTTLLKAYPFELGFAPTGHKTVYGDGKTPEGTYFINRRNPNSQYHLSLGISYPDANDWAAARELGLSPGGDIFIHGTPTNYFGKRDWTWGCIAVSNEHMEEIYAMVPTGTIISIYP